MSNCCQTFVISIFSEPYLDISSFVCILLPDLRSSVHVNFGRLARESDGGKRSVVRNGGGLGVANSTVCTRWVHNYNSIAC